MSNEFERNWKEAVLAQLRYFLGIRLEGLRNATKNITSG
jgi:hypothetical protein